MDTPGPEAERGPQGPARTREEWGRGTRAPSGSEWPESGNREWKGKTAGAFGRGTGRPRPGRGGGAGEPARPPGEGGTRSATEAGEPPAGEGNGEERPRLVFSGPC